MNISKEEQKRIDQISQSEFNLPIRDKLDVNSLRDSALKLESESIVDALFLMNLAKRGRPNGPFIVRKCNEYMELVELKNLSKDGMCNINGLNMFIGNNVPMNLLKAICKGNYEKSEIQLMEKFLTEGDVVLEVGAGIGYMGINAIKSGKCRKYVAYEANPELIKIIKKNMEVNCAKFDIRNEILMDMDGYVDFFVTSAFWGSSLIEPLEGDYKTISVKKTNKNRVIAEIEPSMLIIDIEGGEIEFFKNIDLKNIKKIVMEIHPRVLSNALLTELYRTLINKGFLLDFKSSIKRVVYWYKS